MAITVTPNYPVVDEECTLALTGATGTEFVLELTSKPSASALTLGFLTDPIPQGTATPTSSRQVLDLEVQTDTFTPDVAGEYGFTAYDYRHIVGTPSYPGDPTGTVRHELAATQTGTIYVGDVADLDVVTRWGSGATIRLTITNSTVRAVELVNPTDEHARVACLSANLTVPLAAVVGVAVSALATALQAGTNDLRTNYEAHRVLAGVHPNQVHLVADATNVVELTVCSSQSGAVDMLNDIREKYVHHAEDISVGFGFTWHNAADLQCLPVCGKATDLANAWLLMVDLRQRCYEVHRTLHLGHTPAVHDDLPDTTNVLTAALPLDTLVATLLDELMAASPTAAAGESDGLLLAAATFGARAVKRQTA